MSIAISRALKPPALNTQARFWSAWRGRALAVLLVCAAAYQPAITQAATVSPTATVQGLCDALLGAMKKGSSTDFNGRVKLLDPQIRELYDLPLLTRLVVGPPWRGYSPDDQQALTTAFGDYSIAIYAARFKGYDGEKFEVDPAVDKSPSGDSMVKTKLIQKSGEPVQLNYLVRQEPNGWHIIDVLLNGTISEAAERRSEYAATLRDGGAKALVDLLHKKTDEFKK